MSLLQVIGSELRQSFVAVTVETWAISIYTVLLVVAVKLLLHKERRQSLISKFMLAAIVILWMLDFILWVIDVHNVVVEMDMTLISNSTDSLEDRYAASGDTTLRLALVEAVIYSYMTLLGDLVVLWRVWIFWRDGREILIMLLPLAVYLASMICACLVSYCAAQSHADLSLGVFADPPFCQHIQLTSYCTQFAIALVSTVLIGIKTLRYSRMMRSLGTSSTGKKSSVYRVMMILIDTGVLYMLFFAAEITMGISQVNEAIEARPSLAFAFEIYQYCTSSIVGIYPTAVVILVHTKNPLSEASLSTTRFDTIGSVRASTHGKRRNGTLHSNADTAKTQLAFQPDGVGYELDSVHSSPSVAKVASIQRFYEVSE